MGFKADFSVTITKEEVVTAALPLPEYWLPLSNLDLLLPPVDVSVFYCYKKPAAADGAVGEKYRNFASVVGVLKDAMAQALVSYYVLAGELVPNSVGEPEVRCNNRGVDFIEAYADVELQDLNFYDPDESFGSKLVPQRKRGVLSVQATELKCGGLVVACTFDHRIADAFAANLFLLSWAEMARSNHISLQPSFRRSVLNPSRPLSRIDPSLDDMYVCLSTSPPPPKDLETDDGNLVMSRIYYVSSDQLNELQALASSEGHKRTKLESFSAFLWKMVAQSAAKDDKKVSKMGIVVDGRMRLSEGNKENAKVLGSYFGNVVSIPFAGQKVHDLVEKPLSAVAKDVHDFLQKGVTKEHFLDLIDWVEDHRPEPIMAKIYVNGKDEIPAFVVSSGRGFLIPKVDFGWGGPTFGSSHFPWGGTTGYVMPMPSPVKEGDWVVYMHLAKRQLEFIEVEAAEMFRPLTLDHLQSITTK